MNDTKVFFLVLPTKNKHLDHFYLCPYCEKLFQEDNLNHPCLCFTKNKPWIRIKKFRIDCIYFILYLYHQSNSKGDNDRNNPRVEQPKHREITGVDDN